MTSEDFSIDFLTDSTGTKLGFRVTHLGRNRVSGVDVRWDYESDAASHPRSAPWADRSIRGFDPGESFVHWFPFAPESGVPLFVSAALASAVPVIRFEPVDLASFEHIKT